MLTVRIYCGSLFKKYKPDISEANFPIFDGLVGYAIKYFNDVIKAQKKI
jgi:lysyl-tRNA synthetase class 1